MIVLIALSILCGIVCAYIANTKGLSVGLHTAFGVMLGPIGIVITLMCNRAKRGQV
ncbi:hypothetical protein [uncultured Ruegeria sp.]|uniref:hypothetical protein n=1 Tax=uncultured Ruegeria sp. TaxID=259304 RepID=UPI002629FCEE|nr:hypothetical protein [uncultured Ruegeria sp.]